MLNIFNKNYISFRICWPAVLFLAMGLSLVVSGCTKGSVPKEFGWVVIEGGEYLMGSAQGKGERSEWPQHSEKIKTFEIQKNEATVKQFKSCVDAGTCWTNPLSVSPFCNWGKPKKTDHPMNCINWYQAKVFCMWMGGRLPREAEWEFTARSRGKDITYPWGNEAIDCTYATIDEDGGRGCKDRKNSTSAVCSKPKGNSEQGVCDLAGNVFEWMEDWFYPDYRYAKYKKIPKIYNRKTKVRKHNRVMRGGGIGTDEDQRNRNRVYHAPTFQYSGVGVRCVR